MTNEIEESNAVTPVPESRIADLDRAVTEYQEALEFSDAEKYLLSRGLTEDTINHFRLGYVETPRMGHGHRGWIAIPYLGVDGRPLSIRFRCIQDHDCGERGHGKYAGLAGERTRPYNVRSYVDSDDTIHLTEGEFDTMILQQNGYHAMAIPGAQNYKRHYTPMLSGFSRIYVWGDGDEAGQHFIHRVIQSNSAAVGVPLSDGDDVNSLFLREGAQGIENLIESVDRKE